VLRHVACGSSLNAADDGHAARLLCRAESTRLPISGESRGPRRYKATTGDRVKFDGGETCKDKQSPYDCELDVDSLGPNELWGYSVRLEGPVGCWTARTFKRYGEYQEDVESYQERDWLAPSRADVRDYIRQANALRVLKGCVSPEPGRHVGEDPAVFLAWLASMGVEREFGGTARTTTCQAQGKDEVGFAPDSWNWMCKTALKDGRRFVNRVGCFSPPPYTTYEGCGSDTDYPRRAPRALP
jgi:hypothetical protein